MATDNISAEAIESMCANVQKLFVRAIGLPDVTADMACNALALWILIEKKSFGCNLMSSVDHMSSERPQNLLWEICGGAIALCCGGSRDNVNLGGLIMEADQALRLLLATYAELIPNHQEVQGLLVSTRKLINDPDFSISDMITDRHKNRSLFFQSLRICKSLCAPLEPKAQQPEKDGERISDLMEFRTLDIKMEEPIPAAQILTHIVSKHGPCVQGIEIDTNDSKSAKITFETMQDATRVMGGTVITSITFDVGGKNIQISRPRSAVH